MGLLERAKWIKGLVGNSSGATVYLKNFECKKPIKAAKLDITALGVYEAVLNGKRVGDFVLAPGWTSYTNRIQVQSYDVTEYLKNANELEVTVAQGWRSLLGKQGGFKSLGYQDTALIAELAVEYTDGTFECIATDDSWVARESKLRYTNIYNGDIYDSTYVPDTAKACFEVEIDKKILIPCEGEKITEHERIPAVELIKTPAGETVADFGQNMTGVIEFKIRGEHGKEVAVSCGEVLDSSGNFYNENYRGAKAQIRFICGGGEQTYKSRLSFFGFRYIRLENWSADVKKEDFTAVVIHSDIKRTGYFECGNSLVNQLFKNIIWGQKSNFLDVPTDCPQRDERLGWTGDAQVFIRTASLNFDVERFFKKWLHDLGVDQTREGSVPSVIPKLDEDDVGGSAAWSDAAVICPWWIYRTYGDKTVLEEQFDSMKAWIDWMRKRSKNGLRDEGEHFGDWVGLDAPAGSYKGSTSERLIATAYYKYSTELFIKAAHVIGRDVSEYENIPDEAAAAFRREYMENGRLKNATQTGCVLALYFGITDCPENTATQLNELIKECGHLKTGFVGTPYLLHALSENGYLNTAYELLLRQEYPSWLYPITKGATTIWEHWDGIKPDGTMWSKDMNSFNHYAYGAVGDWLYCVAAGINTCEEEAGFKHIIFSPAVDRRLGYVKASIDTRNGKVASEWSVDGDNVKYTLTVPENSTATAIIGNEAYELSSGVHTFEKPLR